MLDIVAKNQLSGELPLGVLIAINLPSDAAIVGPIALTTSSAFGTNPASSNNTKVAENERAAFGLLVIALTVDFVSNSTVFLLYKTHEGFSH